MTTRLKDFQETAVRSAVTVLGEYLRHLRLVAGDVSKEQQLREQDSALLLEAPTGTGKTLMAGSIAQALAGQGMVWFWFAPFAGLTEQTEGVIRREFTGLRLRRLAVDRQAELVQPGDLYVATWALLANPNSGIHQGGELAPDLAGFMLEVRAQGLRVGVVVDEAHHTFKAQGQAFAVYESILRPDVTLLVTATPNDRDIDRFKAQVGLRHLHRVTVSRDSGVEAGLLKTGVRVGIFRAQSYAALVNFRLTAVRTAVAHHRALKEILRANGVTFTPLLLIQVDSGSEQLAEVEGWLQSLGFTEGQVRKHTADEPNPSLLADAADDTVEVLLFKMAVATGFDAPRAFTLCSLRAVKDADFGVQLVGRILRVDRRLQGRTDLPDEVQYGYVFLADEEGQEGLRQAAARINAIRDSYSSLTNNVVVFEGLSNTIIAAVEAGQPVLLSPVSVVEEPAQIPTAGLGLSAPTPQLGLFDFSSKKGDVKKYGSVTLCRVPAAAAPPSAFTYPLRTDLTFPIQFQTALVALEQEQILDTLVREFPYEEVVDDSRRASTEVILRTTSIFDDQALASRRLKGGFTQQDIARLAQQTLFGVKNGALDMVEAEQALIEGLRQVYETKGWEEADDPVRVLEGWQKILAFNPGKLERAVASVVTRFTRAQSAEPLPAAITSPVALRPSVKNVYGRYPADLNRWELNFAEMLDDLPEVVWWHRNPPRKASSVGIPITGYAPNGTNFYPDLIVGVKGRTQGQDQVLLIEVKGEINNSRGDSVEKAQAIHPTYGNVLMVFWEREALWKVVTYNAATGFNEVGATFAARHLFQD